MDKHKLQQVLYRLILFTGLIKFEFRSSNELENNYLQLLKHNKKLVMHILSPISLMEKNRRLNFSRQNHETAQYIIIASGSFLQNNIVKSIV